MSAALKRYEVQRDHATLVDIVDEVRAVLDWHRKQAGLKSSAPGKRTREFRSTQLTVLESMRAMALSHALASEALERSEVQFLRDKILQGDWLSPSDADAFLRAPVVRMAPYHVFLDLDVDLARLESHFSSSLAEDGSWEATVYAAGISKRFRRTGSMLPGSGSGAILVGGDVVGHGLARVRDSEGRVFNMGYWRGSILDEVQKRAVTLAERFGWEDYSAIWFMLTGEAPLIHPLEASFGRAVTGKVELKLNPWISDRSLLQFVRQIRLVALGRKPPRANAKNLELFTFVERATIAHNAKRPAWRTLMDDWNRAVPDRHRYARVSDFARDYRRAYRVIRRDVLVGELHGVGRYEEAAEAKHRSKTTNR